MLNLGTCNLFAFDNAEASQAQIWPIKTNKMQNMSVQKHPASELRVPEMLKVNLQGSI